jgi:carbamoyl-phosphate synthase large subunit
MPKARRGPTIGEYLKDHTIDLVINIVHNNGISVSPEDLSVRRMAVDLEVPLITNLQIAIQIVEALEYYKKEGLEILSWNEY